MPPTNTTPTSQQLYERLYGMTENLPQIQRLPQIQSEDVIYQDLLKRAETFRPQYEELGRLEARAYETPSTYYKDLTRRYGEGVGKGLSAQGEIASMAGNIGRQLATTDTARRIIETQRGTLSDLAKTLYATRLQDQETMIRNMELERQRRSDEMNALAQLYQFQVAKEQLDLENKRLAGGVRLGGGGGVGLGGGGGVNVVTQPTQPTPQEIIINGFDTVENENGELMFVDEYKDGKLVRRYTATEWKDLKNKQFTPIPEEQKRRLQKSEMSIKPPLRPKPTPRPTPMSSVPPMSSVLPYTPIPR